MLSGHCCYILDANVIRKMNYDQFSDFAERRIPMLTIDEVYYEVRSRKKVTDFKVASLNTNSYMVMAEIINKYQCVRNIISYYDNKGTADVALLAYCKSSIENLLFEDEKKSSPELCVNSLSYNQATDFLEAGLSACNC